MMTANADAVANAAVIVIANATATIVRRSDSDTCRTPLLMAELLSIGDAAVGRTINAMSKSSLRSPLLSSGIRDSSPSLGPLLAAVFFGQRRQVGDQLIDPRESEDLSLKPAGRPP